MSGDDDTPPDTSTKAVAEFVVDVGELTYSGCRPDLRAQADRLLGKKPYDPEAAARFRAERLARKAAAAAKRQPRS